MINAVKGNVKLWSWPNLKYYPYIYLEGLRKITEKPIWDSWSPDQDFNSEPPKFEAGVLITWPRLVYVLAK
jgi:hypothetical protein